MEGGHEGGGATGLVQILAVTAMPALSMLLGSAATSLGAPTERLQSRLQHLSAGLLIGAVVTDIFPIMKGHLLVPPREGAGPGARPSADWCSLGAAAVGFTLGLLLMYTVKNISIQEDGSGEGDAEDVPSVRRETSDMERPLLRNVIAPSAGADSCASPLPLEESKLTYAIESIVARTHNLSELVGGEDVDREAVDEEVHGIDFLVDSIRRLSLNAAPIDRQNASRLRHHATELVADIASIKAMDVSDLPSIDAQLRNIAATLRHIHSHTERVVFRRWDFNRSVPQRDGAAGRKRGRVPWGLVLAVTIDSVVDGMLIGLAGSVALGSGWLMAVATAIEMGFLGYSFACAVLPTGTRCTALCLVGLPPLAMLAASALAAAGADGVEQRPAFVGVVAFALVALLFLVMEELLLEAHEKEGGEVWQSSIWLYAGLLISICLDVLL